MTVNRRANASEIPSSVVGAQTCCAHTAASRERAQQDCAPTSEGSLSLWLWVAGGFLFLGLLWTGMVIATRQADTRTVPLVGREAKP